jgi:endogenous inhibitor of DNA gyrase (YacG/DUF329 family)
MSAKATRLKSRKCPTCGKTYRFASREEWQPYPFCSARCRMADLGSWLSEDYQVVEPITILPDDGDDLLDGDATRVT